MARYGHGSLTRKRKMLIGGAGASILLVITIIILAATLTTRKHPKVEKADILVPLYIFPELGSWEPLFAAASAHPKTNFTIIINPENGPQPLSVLDDSWKEGIARLNSFSNIRTIGYVATGYGHRNIYQVLNDVGMYANWSMPSIEAGKNGSMAANRSLAVRGVFFDEVYETKNSSNADFLQIADRAVKTSSALAPDQLVIHNPGVVPHYKRELSTDVTVVFEGPYSEYTKQRHALSRFPRGDTAAQRAIIVHSMPLPKPGGEKGSKGVDAKKQKEAVKKVVDGMREEAQWLYLTDLSVDYYSAFGASWRDFVDAVAEPGRA